MLSAALQIKELVYLKTRFPFLSTDHYQTDMDVKFALTDRALDRIRQIALEESVEAQSHVLRVAVIPGGCSGLTYDLGWDTETNEKDVLIPAGEFRIAIDWRSGLYMEDVLLDFTDGLEGKGFHFQNEQAARTCACGESFGL